MTTFKEVGAWNLPNRIQFVRENKLTLDQFWDSIEAECFWCHRQRPLKKLVIDRYNPHVRCADMESCDKFRTEQVLLRHPPKMPPEEKKKTNGTTTAKGGKKGSKDISGANGDGLCPASHKADGKKRKCRRLPDHKGKHKDVKGNTW